MTENTTDTETEPETVTIELPMHRHVDGFGDFTVDALFTALDHASAYHNHHGSYADLYDELDEEIFRQIREQL